MNSLERKRVINRKYMRLWSCNNRELARIRANKSYQDIKNDPIRWEKRQATRKLYRERTKMKERIQHKTYILNYRKTKPYARIAHNMRTRLWGALFRKKLSKISKTEELVGCSMKELKIQLENLFSPGMSWLNYGRTGWHIDHIKPLAQFDLSDVEQQKIAFHYTNLQPMWAIDNLRKGNGKR